VTGVTVTEWLESPYLARVAIRVASQHGLRPDDIEDLLQELRLALWKAGPDRIVNATWIYHTANHRAVELWKLRAYKEEIRSSCDTCVASQTSDEEIVLLLRAQVARLPTRLREFYALRYTEALSEREVADRLGVCRASVRWMDGRCQKIIGRRQIV
jgi:RNA polymerase sigma factor (sigma-70 family)